MIQQENRRNKKKVSPGKIVGIILLLLTVIPEEAGEFVGTLIGIALILSPIAIPVIIWYRRKNHREQHQRSLQDTTFTACEQEKRFDEKRRDLFCFHDDKAIHHVARGKEIDPWDRPDIDISKYQRKQ